MTTRAPRILALAVGVFFGAGANAQTAPPAAGAPPSPPPPPGPAAGSEAAPPPNVQKFEGTDVSISPPAPAPVAAPAGTTAPAGEPSKGDHVAVPLTMDEIPVSTANNRVTWNLFGDPMFVAQSTDWKRPAFVLNPLDFLVTGRAGEFMALAEFAVELQEGAVNIDLERMFVGWHTERYQIDAGRTHAELGYWNNAFHHGRWLQMTVERPRAVRFEDEGGILPIHWVGVTGHWHPLLGAQSVEVIGAVGNGRGNIVDDIHTNDDTNSFKALLGKVEFKGFGARDLRMGVSGSFDRIAPLPAMDAAGGPTRPALPDVTINELITNAYVAYRGSELTIISEAFDILHHASGTNWNTFDIFALLAYRFDLLTPYVLLETRTGDVATDPFFFPDPTLAVGPEGILRKFFEVTTGLRVDISTWSALKFEYRATAPSGADTIHRALVDWSFGF
ncbi:MAG TPA: hypothetical protein VKQ32_30020 [Polyangia bacterium]|nr:hypothetical protein [Polyangia bacterium]